MMRSITIGSAETCDLRVTDDVYVSGFHARITETDGGFFIEDLGSTNGTWVIRRWRKDRVYGPTGLGKGDRIVVGRTELPWRVTT